MTLFGATRSEESDGDFHRCWTYIEIILFKKRLLFFLLHNIPLKDLNLNYNKNDTAIL